MQNELTQAFQEIDEQISQNVKQQVETNWKKGNAKEQTEAEQIPLH